MSQLAALRGLSRTEGVDYDGSYVPGTPQVYYLICYSDELRLHLLVVWTTLLGGLMRCTEPCGL